MKRSWWIANVFILLSLIIFFYRPLFSNRLPVPADTLQDYPFFKVNGLSNEPQNRFMYDVMVGFIPWLNFNMQQIRQGSLPLWNPYQACGAPHIANMQSAFFYPLNLFVYISGLKWGLLLLYMLKLYLAGIFLYLYLREIAIDYRIAIISSIAFMYSGFNTGFLYWPHTNLAFYIPLGLLATELILKSPEKINGYIIACLGMSIAVFGGHPEMLFYESSIIIIYFMYRLIKEYGLNKTSATISLKLGIFILIAVLITGVQLIPFIEYLFFSYTYMVRSNIPNNYYLPFFLFSLSIIPDFFNIFLTTSITNVFGGALPVAMGYVGITMFFFFLIGILKLYKNKYVRVSIIILVYIIIVAFDVPLLHYLVIRLPLFRVSSNSFMFGCAPVFIIIISTIAMNQIFLFNLKFNVKHITAVLLLIILFALLILYSSINKSVELFILKQFYFFTGVDIFITVFFLFITDILIKFKNKRYIYFLLGSMVFVQTAIPMIHFEPAIKPAYMYPENKIIRFLKNQPEPFRVFPLTFTKDEAPAWPADITTYYGIEDLRNYDILGIKWYEILFKIMPEMAFLNLVNVKYIVLNSKDTALPYMKQIISDNGFTLYRNLFALNRAFMVYNYKIASTENEYIELMKKYISNLSEIAIISRDEASGLYIKNLNKNNVHNNIEFTAYKPGYMKLNVYTSEPGLLVITDAYFPGWYAYIDGKEAKIIRTDYAFDGIYIGNGLHTVVLKYMPLSFVIGAFLTFLGLVSLPIMYLVVFRKQQNT
ncbi:MAG: YfhO family protein [bacterium]